MFEVGAAAADDADAGRRRSLSAFDVGAAAVVVLVALLRWWTLSQWSFSQDDWLYVNEASRRSLGDLMFSTYNSHLMPGQFLLVWACTRIAPLNYTLVTIWTVVTAVLGVVAWAGALREIFGARWQALVGLVLITCSPILLPASLWWAAALQVLPLQTLGGCAAWAAARHLRLGKRRDWSILIVIYLLALFCWQKAVLLMPLLLLVGVIVTHGTGLAAGRRVAATLWLPTVITAAYLPLWRLAASRTEVSEHTTMSLDRTWSQSADFFGTVARDLLAPVLLGGPWQRGADLNHLAGRLPGWLALLLGALILGGLVAGLVRRRGSWVVLIVGALYLVMAFGMVFVSDRYEEYGVLAGLASRHAADSLPVIALCATFLLTPVRDERPGTASPLVGVLLLVLVSSVAVANVRVWSGLVEHSPQAWVTNLVGDAKRAGEITVIDAAAPSEVVYQGFFGKGARVSAMLAPLKLPVSFDQPAAELFVVAPSGHLKPLQLVEEAQAGPGEVPACGFRVDPAGSRSIAVQPALPAGNWIVRLDYFTGQSTSVVVRGGTTTIEAELTDTLARVYLPISGPVEVIDLAAPNAQVPICLTAVVVGWPKPEARPGGKK